MFKDSYEVHFIAKSFDGGHTVKGFFRVERLTAAVEFFDLVREFYVFDSIEIYRIYEEAIPCPAENM